jgi:hypothetical protein
VENKYENNKAENVKKLVYYERVTQFSASRKKMKKVAAIEIDHN